MDKTPQISVIVPIYRVEQYLPKCIESILVQTFMDFELLLIDDGSPDRCGQICEEYALKDNRIRVFHQENGGVSAARNFGLAKSDGRYIAFVDPDDYVKASYLESLYKMLPSNKEMQGVVIGGFDKSLPNGSLHTVHVPELMIDPKQKYLILTELIDKNIGYPWSKLYDNLLIKQHNISFVPSVLCLEDLLFLLDYLAYSDFMYIFDLNNYVYRVGHSTETLSVRINSYGSEYATFSNFLDRVQRYRAKYDLSTDLLKKTWDLLTIFFHKVILAIYKTDNHYSLKERLFFLQQIRLSNNAWLKQHFHPNYKADILGKYLYCYVGILAFDAWMRFLIKIRFRKMFGAK